jgi:hypothetical protein
MSPFEIIPVKIVASMYWNSGRKPAGQIWNFEKIRKFEIKNLIKLEPISRFLVKTELKKIKAMQSAKFIEVKTSPLVTPSPLVLEAKTSPHLSHRLAGGSRVSFGCGDRPECAPSTPRRPRLAGPHWSWAGPPPQQAALAFWPVSVEGHRPRSAVVSSRIEPAILFNFWNY